MKVQVVFQNLQKSDFVKSFVLERVQAVLDKFPQNRRGRAVVYVSMENSPRHPGPDVFGVKIMIKNSIIKSMVFSKKAGTLFEATAELADGLLETLHRQSDKLIRRERSSQRKWKELTHTPWSYD